MSSKRNSLSKIPLASKQPLLEVEMKKKKKKSKANPKSQTAKLLLEQYGLCPISMEPMRRPVLPSSGQAFDEINIVRYCSSGNRRCPVSGATLKVHKGRVVHTIDFALRNLIRAQAIHAKVHLPSIDKEVLFRELRTAFTPDTAKAVVDDCYLGHIQFDELSDLLDEFSSGHSENGSECSSTAAFKAILSECLACRRGDIVDLAVEYIEVYESAWNDQRVLQEAMAVAQDPDSRGQVLVVLEAKVKAIKYTATHIKTMLGFETESVPVQQFQGRVAQTVITHAFDGDLPAQLDFGQVINLALRVREDLDGCVGGDTSIYDIWVYAMLALKRLKSPIDDSTLERLFWRENRMVLQHLANTCEGLLEWHLSQHKQALSLCISAIGGHSIASGLDTDDGMYSSEEDYVSEEEPSQLPYHGETTYRLATGTSARIL